MTGQLVVLSGEPASCLNEPVATGWNIVQAAGWYSQFAGVLGAVVFAGLVFLLGQQAHRRPTDYVILTSPERKALVLMPVVFVSMLICTLLYAVLSGEQNCERAFSLLIFVGMAFAVAALSLLLTLSWLLSAFADADVARNSNHTFAVMLFIGVFYVGVTIGDEALVTRNEHLSNPVIALVYLILGVPSLVASVARRRGWISELSSRSRWFEGAVFSILVFEAATAVTFVLISDQESLVRIRLFAEVRWFWLVLTGGLFSLLVALLPSPTSSET